MLKIYGEGVLTAMFLLSLQHSVAQEVYIESENLIINQPSLFKLHSIVSSISVNNFSNTSTACNPGNTFTDVLDDIDAL